AWGAAGAGAPPATPRGWGATTLAIPSGRYEDALTGVTLQPTRGRVAASTMFARAPVAVLRSL
ncbi:MAG: hypothetical protein QM581_16930, partial [Pseudomonas sp.]